MENKASRYFLYATGEIVLVVIGILIAVSINNWNQGNKDDKLAKEYLTRIHRDMVQDTTSFRGILQYNVNLRNDIRDVLVVLYEEIETTEQVKALAVVYDNATEQVFSSNQNTYNGMINSGALQLIKNLELKEAIINLYSEYEEKKSLFLGNQNWMIDILSSETVQTDLIKYSPEVLDIYTTEEMLNQDDWSFLNNKTDERFKLIVRVFLAAAWNQKISDGYYLELIDSIKIVLGLLEKELN